MGFIEFFGLSGAQTRHFSGVLGFLPRREFVVEAVVVVEVGRH